MTDISNLVIKEEANAIHDNALELWGRAFNFSHEKGLAEWLKNSVDAYHRSGIADKDQSIIFRFVDGTVTSPPVVECIDFAGMNHNDIQKAFKWWGDPNAAKRGMNIKAYGGHGNGGKFYMRQMFVQSYFITYREGKVNIFGFNENKKYGFAEGFEDKPMSLNDALKLANLDRNIISPYLLRKMEMGQLGFTVVRGIRPKNIATKIPVLRICDRFKYHPQARRPIKFCNVSAIHNGKMVISTLRMEEIEPLSGFEDSYPFDIPVALEINEDGETRIVKVANEKYPQGRLILRTSSIPFGNGNRKADLNCIDVIGEIGVIASYRMSEIGFLQYYPQAQYIYGECSCPILEDPDYDSVQNDREKLLDNDRTRALLIWISLRIDELAGKIAETEQREKEKKDIQTTDEFNQILNKWKNQFMNRLFAEVFGGPGKGDSTGGQGTEGSGGGVKDSSKEKGGLGSGGGEGGGEGDQKKKGARMPVVLLSGQKDPDFPDLPEVNFSERHPPVNQRPQDVARGIYWINMEKPLAKKVMQRYGRESSQWRNYLFQRYVDIFIKETIYRFAKKEGGSLTPEQIDNEIDKIASIVYDKASSDLESFLLDQKYDYGNPEQETNN